MPSGDWLVDYRVAAHLPPLFWVARIRAPVIEVHCGTSVRRASDAFLEGTWSGGPALHDAAAASTVYATGIVLTLDGPLVVTPSQPQEGVYTVRVH